MVTEVKKVFLHDVGCGDGEVGPEPVAAGVTEATYSAFLQFI